MLSKTVLDACPDESRYPQTYSGAPRCSLPYSDAPYSSPTFPTYFRSSLFEHS
ncbi:hypothetical protein SCLCIDRAFT_20500 [Scleroderma citrinum Foug A]|uniref:Uncharacterized protein n=1 Tax=Scleroderma citrinum Foug A TaxID=1036808 RepID=A0A0C3ASW6_9AGAM|nr:hypothetical protein SCLCIDRAFT_20500 [Scleroderma citrinum Foug A]